MSFQIETYINDMDTALPNGVSDVISEGDDWLRQIKEVLQRVFAGFAKTVIVFGEDFTNTNDYVINPFGIQELGDGAIVILYATNPNTGASTLTINGSAPIPIYLDATPTELPANSIGGGNLSILKKYGSALYLQSSGGFESGTKMTFFMASAPTGWAQDQTNNDAMLRITNAYTGSGGVHGLSSPPDTTHSHSVPGHALTLSELPAHAHTFSGNTSTTGAHVHNIEVARGPGTIGQAAEGSAGGGGQQLTTSVDGAHSHAISFTTASVGNGDTHTHDLSSDSYQQFYPKYIDVIVARKL